MKLSQLRPGEKGIIREIDSKSRIKKRLQDMGIVSGEIVEVLKVAPLGDPIEVRVKGYHLSLRKDEAEAIEVEVRG